MTDYAIGIDGGGSTVRVAVVSKDLTIHGQGYAPSTVNPNIVGREQATQTIHSAIKAALHEAKLSPSQISSVGVGVAGALTGDLHRWLEQTIAEVTPNAHVIASSDAETALTGAHGQRRGVIVIAGTGSVAYGINSAGESALVGGWGYLAGDEGSGYWLGMHALRAATLALDGRGPHTPLTEALLKFEHFRDREQIIDWLYQQGQARNRDIAAYATLVLEHAALGDSIACRLVETAARDLSLHVKAVLHRLNMEALPIAFTGGLLSAPNPLSNLLCEYLGLEVIPTPRYPPVIGAALVALLANQE
jgi:N-acetylglucosamine kinase-like BadF-type ATPase